MSATADEAGSDESHTGSVPGFLKPPAFWMPDHITPSGWIEHAPFAFWVIDAHRPRTLVELGTHNGFSYLAFCQAVLRLSTGTRCHAVDHWRGDRHAGFYEEDVFERLRAYHDPRYSAFSSLMRATFSEAASHFADGSIDLLHIDGAHRVEDVTEDFTTWLPKMSERGVILFHDISVRRDDFGVHVVWDQIKEGYPHFAFDHGHGLGVLGVGAEAPRTLGRLFELEMEEGGDAVRAAFRSLGGEVARRAALMAESPQAEESPPDATGQPGLVAPSSALAARAVQRALRSARRGLRVAWWAATLQLPRRLRAYRSSRRADRRA